jgi:kinesin family protein 12
VFYSFILAHSSIIQLTPCRPPIQTPLSLPSQVIRLFAKGMEMRRVAEHQLNRDSSRSHCLLTVHIDSVQMVEGHEQHCKGKITFVDLAGSERLKDSQSAGSTLKETGSINRSLFTLGKVISSLCDKRSVKVMRVRCEV